MRGARARWLVLGTLLVVALSVTLGADRQGSGVTEVVAASVPKHRAATSAVSADAGSAQMDLTRMSRLTKTATTEEADLFGVHSWQPVPPPSRPAPAPRPTAPPLPFVYLGKMTEGGAVTVFLSQQGRPHIVKAGDTIERTYRVEAIADKAVTLTYLPLDIKQQLSIGAAE